MQNNKCPKWLIWVLVMLPCTAFLAQTPLEGEVMEHENRNLLNEATVTVFELPANIVRAVATTDQYGQFSFLLTPGLYRVSTRKDIFEERQDTVWLQSNRIFIQIEMRRMEASAIEARQEVISQMEKSPLMHSRDRQLPEANNSIPLPEFAGTVAGESPDTEQSVKSGAPLRGSDADKPTRPTGEIKMSPLDSAFTGYAIQLLRNKIALNMANPVFKNFKEIRWQQEADSLYYYYVLPTGSFEQIRKYYRKTVKPNHREARLLRIDKKGKSYIK